MTEDDRSSGSDPIGDFQRWLMRSSARRMGKELRGQARRALGGASPERGDVWEVATSEPVPDEAPECAWCPVCRAARRFRLNGPGLASQVAGAGDTLLTVAQDTLAAFEATLTAAGQRPGTAPRRPGPREPAEAAPGGTGWPDEAVMSRVAASASPHGTARAGQDPGTADGHDIADDHGPVNDRAPLHDHGPVPDRVPVHDHDPDDQGAAPGGPDRRD